MNTVKIHWLICHTPVVVEFNGSNQVVHVVGSLIPVLAHNPVGPESTLIKNFIRPQGQKVLIKNYPLLFQLYGHKYSWSKPALPLWQRICNYYGAKFKEQKTPLCNLDTEFVLPKM